LGKGQFEKKEGFEKYNFDETHFKNGNLLKEAIRKRIERN
jgi:hypothetical protein